MIQLSLFDWAEKESLLNELGGRCAYCLEWDRWLTTDYWSDDRYDYTTVECQTVLKGEDGEFAGLCKNQIEIVEDRYEGDCIISPRFYRR